KLSLLPALPRTHRSRRLPVRYTSCPRHTGPAPLPDIPGILLWMKMTACPTTPSARFPSPVLAPQMILPRGYSPRTVVFRCRPTSRAYRQSGSPPLSALLLWKKPHDPSPVQNHCIPGSHFPPHHTAFQRNMLHSPGNLHLPV